MHVASLFCDCGGSATLFISLFNDFTEKIRNNLDILNVFILVFTSNSTKLGKSFLKVESYSRYDFLFFDCTRMDAFVSAFFF